MSSWSAPPDPFRPTSPTLRLIGFGDSFILGGGCLLRICSRVQQLIASETSDVAEVYNLGINGVSYNYSWAPNTTYPYTLTQDVSQRLGVVVSGTALPVWVLLQAGTNGITISGHSAATEYSDFQSCLSAIIAAGVMASRIIVGTMPPRGAGVESARTAFNSALVSGAASLGHKLARIDSDINIGQANQNTDTTYYQADAVHWNDAGAAKVARIFKDAMYA